MNYEQIKAALAPCGLNCVKCFAHVNGEIRRLSQELKEGLGNFEAYAKRFETLIGDPVFKKYPNFMEMIDYLASSNCSGCRNEQCRLFKDCGVRVCHQQKQVDFCFQCSEFPCAKTNFDQRLNTVWLKVNEKIRAEGLEAYYQDSMNRPRYP